MCFSIESNVSLSILFPKGGGEPQDNNKKGGGGGKDKKKKKKEKSAMTLDEFNKLEINDKPQESGEKYKKRFHFGGNFEILDVK